jgi:hypothetical protein
MNLAVEVPGTQSETGEPTWTFRVSGTKQPNYDTNFLPLSASWGNPERMETSEGRMGEYERARMYEHIAGPNCLSTEGYHGSRITIEEMRGCHTVQCLVPKKEGWRLELGDLDFELEGKYHLTGLSDHMPSSGWRVKFAPARHGVEDRDASFDVWDFVVRVFFLFSQGW